MYSGHHQQLCAPDSAEQFVNALAAISAEAGAQRFMVLRINGVSMRNVAQAFHNGGPAVEAGLATQAGRLAVDRLLVQIYAAAVPSTMLAPGELAIEGFDYGCAVMVRGERTACVVVFAGPKPPAAIMDMMGAAHAAAQCALAWFVTLPAKVCPLSERELQCLLHYLAFPNVREAAVALGISARTVEGHLERARLRCGVETTLAAAMQALDEGWIQPSDIRRLEAAG